MNSVKRIRTLLGVTQEQLARALGMTQGNVAFYERGQTIPPDAAKRLIDYAASYGREVTLEEIYQDVVARPACVATESVASTTA